MTTIATPTYLLTPSDLPNTGPLKRPTSSAHSKSANAVTVGCVQGLSSGCMFGLHDSGFRVQGLEFRV